MDYLYLIPAILGFTQALKTQFPHLLGSLAPWVALVVAAVLYVAARNMNPDLFGLLIATGSAMGLYTGIDKITTTKVKLVQ